MSLQEDIINGIIEREGGYVDDPNDSGGETNWGITLKVAREWGYAGAMVDLPRETAYEIYSSRYWHELCADDIELLSERICAEVVDTGVNTGVVRAARFLQRALNVLNNRQQYYQDIKADGHLGVKTINALNEYLGHRGVEGEIVLHRMLNGLQSAFYTGLAEDREKDEAFVYGWHLHRVEM